MIDMISNAGKFGEKKAECRLRKLIGLLYENDRMDDIKKIVDDEKYLEELYQEYNL